MRYHELITEGYKEATADFSQAADPGEVTKVIDQYKTLVQKNQVSGNERNIDWWRKQGWDKFRKFVEVKIEQPTASAIKRKRVTGKQITLEDSKDWLIVIPLDKASSCFHGKHQGNIAAWCTTKENQNHFEKYFYDNNVVLVYCLNKTNGGMWAMAVHKDLDKVELFDASDSPLTADQFKNQTGIDPARLKNLALSSSNSKAIQSAKDWYNDAKNTIGNFLTGEKKTDPTIISRIESLIVAIGGYGANEFLFKYGSNNPLLQLMAVKKYGEGIRNIKNPSEKVQLAAVKQDGIAIRHILNPSLKVQLAAVNKKAGALMWIKDPSEEVQLAAVKKDPDMVRVIEDPSEEVQLAVVKQDGGWIDFIKNPTERVKITANTGVDPGPM